jgi:hypothetical protein
MDKRLFCSIGIVNFVYVQTSACCRHKLNYKTYFENREISVEFDIYIGIRLVMKNNRVTDQKIGFNIKKLGELASMYIQSVIHVCTGRLYYI